MMDRKKLNLAGLVLCVISLILQLIGYLSPGWVVMVIYLHVIGAVLGMGITGFGELTTSVSVWYGTVCMESDTDDGSCTTRTDHDARFYGFRVTNALTALAGIEWTRIQILLTLALILCCVGVVLALLAVLDKFQVSPRILSAIAAASMAASGILILPAACEVIIAITIADKAVSIQTEVTGHRLVELSVPWTIVLILLGVLIALVATVLLILATITEEHPKTLGITPDSTQALFDLDTSLDRTASVISTVPPPIGAPDKEPLVFGGGMSAWGHKEDVAPASNSLRKNRRFFLNRDSSVIIGPPSRKSSETNQESGCKSSSSPSIQTGMPRTSTGTVSLSKIPLMEKEQTQGDTKQAIKVHPQDANDTKLITKKVTKQTEKLQTKQAKADTKTISKPDNNKSQAWIESKQDADSQAKQDKKDIKLGSKTGTKQSETMQEPKQNINSDAKQDKVENNSDLTKNNKQGVKTDLKQQEAIIMTQTGGKKETKQKPKQQNTKAATIPKTKQNSAEESKQGIDIDSPTKESIGTAMKEEKIVNDYYNNLTTENVPASRPLPKTSKSKETPRDKKAVTKTITSNGKKMDQNKVTPSPITRNQETMAKTNTSPNKNEKPADKSIKLEAGKKTESESVRKDYNDVNSSAQATDKGKTAVNKTADPRKNESDQTAVIVVSPYGNKSPVMQKRVSKLTEKSHMTEKEQKFQYLRVIYGKKLTHDKDKYGRIIKNPPGGRHETPRQVQQDDTVET